MNESIVNIFIDSTALFSDPFWKQNFSRVLLDLQSKTSDIRIFISSVVLEETENNFKKRIKSLHDRISNAIRGLNSLVESDDSIEIEIPSPEAYLESFQDFYRVSFSKGIFIEVPLNNQILPEVISRAVKRKDPFFTDIKGKKKQEFRDAIIWLSYTDYIRLNGLSNCFFISANKTEFWDEENSNLHPDLFGDCTNIKIYETLRELILNEEEILRIKGKKEFEEWIENQDFNHDKISSYLLMVWESFIKKLIGSIDFSKPHKYFDDEKISWFELFLFDKNFEIKNYDIITIQDSAYIDVDLVVNSSSKIYKMEFFDSEIKKVLPITYVNKLNCNLILEVRKEEIIKIKNVKVSKISLVDELF
ncbi:hypothetical protein FGF1_24170 [Flavobacteriaceae bacterium GF1]